MTNNKNENYEQWVNQCLKCKHCYRKQNDADMLFCRLRKGQCKFEEVQKNA